VQTTSIVALLIIEKVFSILVLIIKASVIKLSKQYYSCIRNIIVYILEITILNLNRKKNILIRYKSLFVETFYLF